MSFRKPLALAAAALLTIVPVTWQAAASGRLHALTTAILARSQASTITSEHSTSAAAPSRVIAEGRIVAYPGAQVVVGSEAAGLIIALPVEEKSVVRRGDLIVELRADDLRAERTEAEARIQEADADIRFHDREVRREEALRARQSGTQHDLDSQRRALDNARARRAAARAVRDRLDARLAKMRIVAPIDGVVTARHVHPGETIEPGARLVTIADLDRLRVEAEVDEFDTANVVLGARVVITAEGHATAWNGAVEEIPDTVIPRRIRPEDPGRPVDARVLPVKITLENRGPLKLGQRVEVAIVGPSSVETGER